VVEFPWGRVSDPAGVAPEPLEEFLTPSRVMSPNFAETLSTPVVEGFRFFCAGVSTYSR